jgi:polar amino acid transport system permease protein
VGWTRFFTVGKNSGGPPPPAWARAANFLLVGLAMSLVFYLSFLHLSRPLQWSSIAPYREMFLRGWLTTLLISAAALAGSSVVGLLVAMAGRSPLLALRYFSRIYVEVVRGTPLLVQILILFYVVADAFGLENRYVAGVLILSLFSGAYIAEIIRAGIESVGKSQLESAQAIGLTRAQTYRYVIFPQALRQTLPPLAGQFASLIKDSSLLSIIGLTEFTWNAQAIGARTFGTLESYLPLAAGYLVLTLPISLWTRHLERRHKFET